MTMLISTDEAKWQEHPVEAGVKTKPFAQFPEYRLRLRINLIARKGLDEHSHPHGYIFYLLHGRGKMWVEDVGNLELSVSTFIVIPPDLRHRVFDVIEPIELLSIGIVAAK